MARRAGPLTATAAGAVPPKPYDPTLPIDLGGVEGVTLQQQAAAENLLSITITRLPQFEDVAVAESMGFVSLEDGFTGHEHYLNAANMNDDKILDPDYPESLVYDVSVTPKKLVAAMYMLNPGDTLADVPDLGGSFAQWHIHTKGCQEPDGDCGAGEVIFAALRVPMMHVWIDTPPMRPVCGVGGGRRRNDRGWRDPPLRSRARRRVATVPLCPLRDRACPTPAVMPASLCREADRS